MNSFFINFGFILLYIEEETFTPAKNREIYEKYCKDARGMEGRAGKLGVEGIGLS
jgi:hypothetical protein